VKGFGSLFSNEEFSVFFHLCNALGFIFPMQRLAFVMLSAAKHLSFAKRTIVASSDPSFVRMTKAKFPPFIERHFSYSVQNIFP
jgi:hypothetical protein